LCSLIVLFGFVAETNVVTPKYFCENLDFLLSSDKFYSNYYSKGNYEKYEEYSSIEKLLFIL